MSHTRASTVIAWLVIGAVGGYLLQALLATSGQPIITLDLLFGLVLVAIGVLVVAAAMPVRRMVRGTAERRVDPFYATRVVVFAKASALIGALFAGVGAGFSAYLVTRSVVQGNSVFMSTAALVGGVVLLVCGLVAERMCTVPPRDDDDDDDRPNGVGAS